MIWSRLVPGAALLLGVGLAVARSAPALVHGHWAYPALLAVAAALGLALVVWGLRGSTPARGVVPSVLRWAAAAAGLGLAALCWWLAPYPALSTSDTAVTAGAGITMGPDEAAVGVAFIPGALVDPRAYENLFAPVAQAGYPVYIATPAFGLAFTVPDVVADARTAVPGVQRWVVAGHSLGGAVAAGQTADADGLLLLAAYPIGDVSDAGVPALSVTAGNDTLTTPADVDATRDDLPPGTVFTTVAGGIHAYFGDYGPQRGDGQPAVTRTQQQAATQAAMLDFLQQVDQGQPQPTP